VLSFTNAGQLTRAIPLAQQMDALGIDSQIAQLVLLTDHLANQKYDAALADLQDGLSVGPLVDGLVRGWSLLGTGDKAAAIAAFDEAARTQGLEAFALYHKALALAVDGDYAASVAILDGGESGPLRLTRRGTVVYAQMLAQLGRGDQAADIIRAGFNGDMDPGLAALLARFDSGADVPFDFLTSVQDGLAEVFYTVAGALNGEAADSYTLLYSRIATHLRPTHTDAILLSAALLERQDQYDLATAAYDRVPRDDPAFHASEMGRADALRRAGNPGAAIEVLSQLSETHGFLPAVHVAFGDALRQEERYAEATLAYDKALALYGPPQDSHWIVYYARGITHEREDRWPEAEADFRQALALRPNQPSVLNYLGYSMVEMQINLDEALEMIERAVAAQPNSGYITDSLGWVLYRMGEYMEAVGYMERAVELMPVDPIINDHLGDVYWAVDRKIEAQFQWKRALSFDSEGEEAPRIRRKLEVGLDVVLEEEGAPPLAVASDDG
jgi:tetratricopeptide (TPR) repeat protein